MWPNKWGPETQFENWPFGSRQERKIWELVASKGGKWCCWMIQPHPELGALCLSLSRSRSLSLFPTFSVCVSHFLSLSHTHTHTHTITRERSVAQRWQPVDFRSCLQLISLHICSWVTTTHTHTHYHTLCTHKVTPEVKHYIQNYKALTRKLTRTLHINTADTHANTQRYKDKKHH